MAAVMYLAMVSSTQGNGVLIADLAPEGPTLGKPEVVGIGGSATANETRVPGDRFDVISITNPAGLRQCQRAFIDPLRSYPIPCLCCFLSL